MRADKWKITRSICVISMRAAATMSLSRFLSPASERPDLQQKSFLLPGVSDVYMALPSTVPTLLAELLELIPYRDVDIESWEHAAYRPVPTIIEAARNLYAKHGVSDIRAARADTANLSQTTDSIQQAIREARVTRQHLILFVTGIPGAGKTLCGLNAIFSERHRRHVPDRHTADGLCLESRLGRRRREIYPSRSA